MRWAHRKMGSRIMLSAELHLPDSADGTDGTDGTDETDERRSHGSYETDEPFGVLVPWVL